MGNQRENADDFRTPPETEADVLVLDLAQIAPILELFAEDSQLNVYVGELAVRPPRAPASSAA